MNTLEKNELKKIRNMREKYYSILKTGGVDTAHWIEGLSIILLSDILDELKKLNEKSSEIEDEKTVITPKKIVAKKTTQVKE